MKMLYRASEMAQQVKAPALQACVRVPRTQVKVESDNLGLSSNLHTCSVAHMSPHTYSDVHIHYISHF